MITQSDMYTHFFSLFTENKVKGPQFVCTVDILLTCNSEINHSYLHIIMVKYLYSHYFALLPMIFDLINII